MTFTQSVNYCLTNYFKVSGRGGRSEYWWFMLTAFVASMVAALADAVVGHRFFNPLLSLGLFIPEITAGTRRLHDRNRSGWWQLIVLVPLIGFIVLIFWFIGEGTPGPNRYGDRAAG
jgi:uncharacterized membrane protein YhaH (DUF805 family)